MELQCEICCDKFTTKRRKLITCDYTNCKAKICQQCFRRFLLMEESKQVCMACKQYITTNFIFTHTPLAFKTQYLNKIVTLDLVKERALLPSTQERLDSRVRSKVLSSRIAVLRIHLKYHDDDEMMKVFTKSQNELDELKINFEEDEGKTTYSFCPMDTCTGIVKYDRCTTCKKTICGNCKELLLDEHECKKEQLETVNLLERDTKQCPTCNTPIYKIDGCDQMFCTRCRTVFSWNTLKIDRSGIIHNPHYDYTNVAGVLRNPYGEEVDLREIINQSNTHNRFIPLVLEQMNAILPVLISEVNEEGIGISKLKLRESYLIQRTRNIKKADDNWVKQLTLLYKRCEMKKDLIVLIQQFQMELKDLLIVGYTYKNYAVMFTNIDKLIKDFSEKLRKSEKINTIKNNTTITIYAGLECGLII